VIPYEVVIEVSQGSRRVVRLVCAPMSGEYIIKGIQQELSGCAEFLSGCIRADVLNQERHPSETTHIHPAGR